MNRKPLHTVRSDWHIHAVTDPTVVVAAERRTHDGRLRVLVTNDGSLGLHLSISHVGHRGEIRRYPGWDEIADARDVFLPAELGFVMHLPPADEYVALHDTTFHLHQHPAPGHPSAATPAPEALPFSVYDEPHKVP